MGCALETFEEILNYLHRESIMPKFFSAYKADTETLSKIEQECDDTGCSLNCVAHKNFGLEFGELLYCESCSTVNEVQNSHLDFFMNLYASELIEIQA
jgi:hypothetical protein